MKNEQIATTAWRLLLGLVLCASLCAAQQTETTVAKASEDPTAPVITQLPATATERAPQLERYTAAKVGEAPTAPGIKPPLVTPDPLYLKGKAAIIHNLPDTPSAPEREKAGFWTARSWEDPPLRTNLEIIQAKTWSGAQGFWLGSIVYDCRTHPPRPSAPQVRRGIRR